MLNLQDIPMSINLGGKGLSLYKVILGSYNVSFFESKSQLLFSSEGVVLSLLLGIYSNNLE